MAVLVGSAESKALSSYSELVHYENGLRECGVVQGIVQRRDNKSSGNPRASK